MSTKLDQRIARLRRSIADAKRYDELCQARDWQTIELEMLNPSATMPADEDILAVCAAAAREDVFRRELLVLAGEGVTFAVETDNALAAAAAGEDGELSPAEPCDGKATYEGKTADEIATMWVRELARAEAAEAKYHAGVDAWLATRHELANALQRVKELEAQLAKPGIVTACFGSKEEHARLQTRIAELEAGRRAAQAEALRWAATRCGNGGAGTLLRTYATAVTSGELSPAEPAQAAESAESAG
jgi:hypothetical protein